MTKTFADHLRRAVSCAFPPRRLVSLCPSLTETLFALECGDRVVGRTRYCVHPMAAVGAITVVGGTKDVDGAAVARLCPDLIIAEKEENRRLEIEVLAEWFPVYVMDVTDYEGALGAIRDLGALVDCAAAAQRLVDAIRTAAGTVPWRCLLRTAYLIWQEPYMVAGAGTFIHAVMQRWGLENVGAFLPGRYPQVSLAQLQALRPELVLLASEPYAFRATHASELAPAFPAARVMCVEGEWFSWYGSRMVMAAEALNAWRRQVGG